MKNRNGIKELEYEKSFVLKELLSIASPKEAKRILKILDDRKKWAIERDKKISNTTEPSNAKVFGYLAARYIDSLRTSKGGFDKAALLSLGASWPPKKGWRKKLIKNGVRVR